ncbi:hypothetical protein BGZ60DRAFT_512226 [Tricladium varicosporioides]|nr:hypothetical protein BGZ60DRAFT_512226 [Hymenoscyphus varicosporioides]
MVAISGNLREKKNVVIIGGSLAGLFTGITLSRLGHNVTILERSTSATLVDQGAGISISPVIPPIILKLKALATSGAPIVDFFKKYDRTRTPIYAHGDGFQYLKKDGSVRRKLIVDEKGIGGLGVGVGAASWDLLYNVLRANFDGGFEDAYVEPAPKQPSDGEAVYKSAALVTGLKDLGAQGVEVTYRGLENRDIEEKTMKADFVVGADGSGSVMRRLLDPTAERTYVGYAGWRGTVKESLLTQETNDFFGTTVTLFFTRGVQILTYKIPGLNGNCRPGERLANMVWYNNYSQEEVKEILKDVDGKQHQYSLGIGRIQPGVKARQQQKAVQALPKAHAELFTKVEAPFIQAVTDNLATKSVFMDGKIVLVGDALAGVRPHTTCGTTQAALHALMLGQSFEGQISIEEWGKKTMEFGIFVQGMGKQMGNLSQFGDHPDAIDDEE